MDTTERSVSRENTMLELYTFMLARSYLYSLLATFFPCHTLSEITPPLHYI